MKLMDVEGVQLGRTVLDDPVLHVALQGDDVWCSVRRFELRRRLAFLGNVKIRRTIRVFGVLKFLGEIEASHPDRLDVAKPGKRGQRQWLRERGKLRLWLGGICGRKNGGERPVRIVFTTLPGIDSPCNEERGYPDGRPLYNEFHASARRHTDVIDPGDRS